MGGQQRLGQISKFSRFYFLKPSLIICRFLYKITLLIKMLQQFLEALHSLNKKVNLNLIVDCIDYKFWWTQGSPCTTLNLLFILNTSTALCILGSLFFTVNILKKSTKIKSYKSFFTSRINCTCAALLSSDNTEQSSNQAVLDSEPPDKKIISPPMLRNFCKDLNLSHLNFIYFEMFI